MSDQGVNDQSFGDGQAGNPPASPGAQLAAYRQERGWTVEQVASQLNLAQRQIVAIESDDYASLPGMPIVRGFIRAYAKLLKVDAVPLLAMIGGETVLAHAPLAPHKTLAAPFSEARLPSMSERPGLSSKWIVGFLLLVLFAAAFWALQQRGDFMGDSNPLASSPVPSESPSASAGVDTPAPPPTPSAAEEPAQPGITPDAAPKLTGAEPAPSGTTAEAGGGAQTAPSSVAAEVPAAPGKDTLVLNVHEDSWIEARRAATNAVLLSRIVKAGESETIDVKEPVSLVIGNAAGVDATLRGKSLPLKAGAGNVARLNLK